MQLAIHVCRYSQNNKFVAQQEMLYCLCLPRASWLPSCSREGTQTVYTLNIAYCTLYTNKAMVQVLQK